MREMAQSSRRRHAYRFNLLLQLAFPLVIAGFGAIVLLLVLTCFLPLITLIENLA